MKDYVKEFSELAKAKASLQREADKLAALVAADRENPNADRAAVAIREYPHGSRTINPYFEGGGGFPVFHEPQGLEEEIRRLLSGAPV